MASEYAADEKQDIIINITNELFKNYFDFNSEKNIISRPPSEAYLYFPSGDELIIADEKKLFKFQRKIFDSIDYTEMENQKLEEFKHSLLDSEKENILKFSTGNLMRFLQSSDYDSNKTKISIQKHLEWFDKTLPIKVNNNIISILNSGFIYILGRDHCFRPNIICSPKYFMSNTGKYSFEDWLSAVVFILEYCINNLFIPGQVENWNLIVDLKDVSLYSVPADLKNIMTIVQENYKCRLNTMYVVNLGSFGNILWKIIKKILGENIERKLKMIRNFEELNEFIHIEQLEKKFGGEAENTPVNLLSENLIEENLLFPPKVVSNNYLPSEKTKNLLISNEEYIEKIKYDPKIVKSPYLKDPMSVELLIGVPIFELDGEVFLTARENFVTENNENSNGEQFKQESICDLKSSDVFQVKEQNNANYNNYNKIPELSLEQINEKSELIILRSEEMSISSRRNQVVNDKNENENENDPNSNSPFIQKCKRAIPRSQTKDEFPPILHAKSISTNSKSDYKSSIVTNNLKNKEYENSNQVKIITSENHIQSYNSTPGNLSSNVPCFECEIKIEKETRRGGCGGLCGDSKSLCLIF